ncbi:MAG: hypothetical protein HYY76_19195 [Acidobacteria bacterium]|nr:hypothetical protein [Acidobacteriota bacterium]
MSRELDRRAFLCAVAAGVALARRAAAHTQAERLIAAMQDGGKIIYLHHFSSGGLQQARALGRALRALRVPLNDIVAAPAAPARETAETAFGADRVSVATELVGAEDAGDRLPATLEAMRRLLRTIPGPGMNRVLVGHRTPLELAAERRFPEPVFPDGAMAVFLPARTPQLLGTITAERVIASAKARGAM